MLRSRCFAFAPKTIIHRSSVTSAVNRTSALFFSSETIKFSASTTAPFGWANVAGGGAFMYFLFCASATTAIAFCAAPQNDSSAAALSWQQITAVADGHHDRDEVAQSYEVMKRAAIHDERFKANPEIQWRYGRALYLMGKEQMANPQKREEFTRESIAALQRALDVEPDNWAANKWMGMALGALGDFVSTKERIGNGFKIRDHFAKAIQGNARDATSFHCMGTWCWNILQVTSIERSVASWIFATPPTTSFEECEQNLLKSHDLDQTQPHNSLLLGDIYVWKGDTDAARKCLRLPGEHRLSTRLHQTGGKKIRRSLTNESKQVENQI